jgi:uncharacterized protein (DUF58 family)
MVWVILILLALAAAFGVLGAVLKATAFVLLTIALVVTLMVAFGWWWFKKQVRAVQRDHDRQVAERRLSDYYAQGDRAKEAERGEEALPPLRDDRY